MDDLIDLDALEKAKQALDDLQKLIGTPDDPNIGWRGNGTHEVFACEFCNHTHSDCTAIPHTPRCPVPKAHTALAAIRSALPQFTGG